MAFGTSKLLLFPDIEQAIVDFNLKMGTFTFIERADLKLGSHEQLQNLARYFILAGSVYNQDDMRGIRTLAQLQADLEKICDPNPHILRKNLLKPNTPHKVLYFFDLMKVIQDLALSLSKERKIVCIKK